MVMETPRDQRHYEPESPEALEREFGGHAWKAVNSLWYWSTTNSSPPLTAERAEDLLDLRDKIISAIWRRDNGLG
jgi:hypothetical protein